jgi:Putative bacterial sensory transduction regulator
MSAVAGSPTAATVEAWLSELGIEPSARSDREGLVAWDLELDGRRRFDVRFTVILDPAMGLITWVHYAPPIGDGLRKSYHRLLRWNDEFPFVKFSLAEDGRPILSQEVPVRLLDRDELGAALVRSLAICDALLEESAGWLWIGGRIPDQSARLSRNPGLFERYADRLPELFGS